jgi:serine/threonine protein kinase
LGQKNYTFAVDIWAVGCIFAELFLKRPLFLGNGYEIEQIFKIFEILGTPKQSNWPNLQTLPDYKFSFPKW